MRLISKIADGEHDMNCFSARSTSLDSLINGENANLVPVGGDVPFRAYAPLTSKEIKTYAD